VRLPSLKILSYRIQRLLGNKVVLRPTLEQLVSYINNIRPGVTLLLDLKTPGTGKALASFLERTNSLGEGEVFVSSRYHIELDALRSHKVKRLVTLISRPLNIRDYLKGVGADGVSIEYPYVDKELVEELHNSGFFVAVWTVNDSLVAKHLAKIGVDMIITDTPRRVIRALKDDNSGKRRRMRLKRP
jgi:glycerophosphoryl diester phosphodiesterase